MQLRDIIFFVALLGSIPFGYLVKRVKSPSVKRFICTVAGVFLVLFLNGFQDFWHSFLTILATYCICKSSSYRLHNWHWLTFVCVFGYLLFFRACAYVGLPHPSPYSDNVQLFVTLRMVGLAFEIHEISVSNKSGTSNEQNKTEITDYDKELLDMSFYHFLSFGYCYCGIFTGPYYKYKTYSDMLNQSNPEDIPSFDLALKWLSYLPIFLAGYAFFSQWFPAYLGKDQFHNQSIFMQIILLALADIRFRCRLYIGTHMSESSAMTLCLGAYPVESCPKPGHGPTRTSDDSSPKHREDEDTDLVTIDNKFSFETIRGMCIRKVELSSLKDMIRSWNMTVQWWMAAYVYQKFPYRKKMVRYLAVAAVSAFWHGLAPGYYLSFLFIPLAQEVQDRCSRKFLPYLNERHQVWYLWVSWFIGYRLLEYFGVGVWVHSMSLTLRCWKSMRYYGHILLFVLFLLTLIVPDARSKQHEKTSYEKPLQEKKTS